MLRPKTKRNVQQLIPFGVIWLLSGWVFLIIELAASGSFSELPSTAIKIDYQIFILSSLAVTTVGLLTGFIELRYLSNIFANKNFALRIMCKILIYALFFFLIILVTFPIAASMELDTHIFDKNVWEKYLNYFTSVTHLSTGVQLAASLMLSLFYSEISAFMGHRVLSNFFTGKYHTPIEEERIFMFLDMKSSTTIAEKLGHLEYFKLLRAYYDCFTNAIIDHKGEIYQYVGDEIILSWKVQKSKESSCCIDCFFAMREHLKSKEDWFKSQFGLAPTFKAGIHFGKVTTGEIGAIKKEILFSGDVLNVAARIQGLCNSYNTDLIISDDMLKQIELQKNYTAEFLGTSELRGKEEKKDLYTIFLN